MHFKLVVYAVLYRKLSGGRIQIMTQTRNPNFHKRDPDGKLVARPDSVYGGLEEVVAETVRPGEEILDALARGIREETKVGDFMPCIESSRWWTHGGEITSIRSICWTEARLSNRALHGPAFLMEVNEEFLPSYSNVPEAEAISCTWWELECLTTTLNEQPERFVGYHLPAVNAAVNELSTKKEKK